MLKNILIVAALLFFCVNSFFHLFRKKYGNLTKALILPSILACYLLLADNYSVVLILGMFFSWLGDVLLEKQGFRWFTAGGIAFIASHLLYGLSYIPHSFDGEVSAFIVVPVAAVYCIVSAVTIFSIRRTAPKNSVFLLYVYLLANSFMNVIAFIQLMNNRDVSAIIVYIGAVLFFISDNCLFIECFHRKKPNLFIPVMGTYIFGEFFIAAGSAFLR